MRGRVMADRGVQDRARGALLGLAAGDAVGTTLEFRSRDSYEPLTDMIGGGPFDLKPGEWTDDTSMALALADSLVATGEFDAADLMQRFVRWWRKGEYSVTGRCFDIGITTSRALARFEGDGNPYAGSRDPGAAGNGSLMRLAPVAIWGVGHASDDMRDVARRQSETTHAAPTCLDACEAVALLLRALIGGASFETALAEARAVGAVDPIATILAGDWQSKARDEIRSSGYVAHSLEAALWCVARTEDFRSAVLLAANLGDDADTTAAITGQIGGALYGANGIPADWLDKLAWRARITDLADRLLAVA
jgi:ADP-ribosyl-[dinitrogen reductase] hydrolase